MGAVGLRGQGCADIVSSELAGPWQLSVVPCYAKHTDPHSLLQPGLEQGPLPDLLPGHPCKAVPFLGAQAIVTPVGILSEGG